MSPFGLIRLQPTIQTYDWGRTSENSLVYKLAQNSVPDFADVASRYAELWIGAHPSSPSVAMLNEDERGAREVDFSAILRDNAEEILGQRVFSLFGGRLPFLFKVLSIAAPLSIQAHPNLQLAAVLNEKNPGQYPDANHKPECSIALGPVELLYGFKSKEDLLRSIVEVPELFTLIPDADISHLKSLSEADLRRDVLSAVMRCDAAMMRSACTSLKKRLAAERALQTVDSWVLSLCEKYPDGDPGIFCFYLMNFETLNRGEAIFIGPNIAHAYLSGELVECMANSDNVVRAGLTAKHKDVPTLLAMLDYRVGPLEIQRANSSADGVIDYTFPVEEYALTSVRNADVELHTRGAELLFILEGSARVISEEDDITLVPGEGLIVSAQVSQYRLIVDKGVGYRVSVP